jgi:hypothetical protein
MGGDNTDAGGRGSGGVAGGWSIGTIGRLTHHFPKKKLKYVLQCCFVNIHINNSDSYEPNIANIILKTQNIVV